MKKLSLNEKNDPEIIILIFGIIGALGGLAAIIKLEIKIQEIYLSKKKQLALRKRAKRALQQIWSDLSESKEILDYIKKKFEHASLKLSNIEFKIGQGLVELSEAEEKRFFSKLDKICRLQKSIIKATADLRDVLPRISSYNNRDAESVEMFKSKIVRLIESFNSNIFSINTVSNNSINGRFKKYSIIVEAIEGLITECSDSIKDLEAIMGKEYDD